MNKLQGKRVSVRDSRCSRQRDSTVVINDIPESETEKLELHVEVKQDENFFILTVSI